MRRSRPGFASSFQELSWGTYSAYLAPMYRGNARDYLASLRRLRDLPPPDLILPGHPRMDPIPQSPRLGAERWQGLLDQGISEMEKLLARYDADGADFLDGHAKELLPGLDYLGDSGGAAVYVLNGPKGLLLFDAPGDDLLVAFLAQRFAKLGWEGKKVSAVLLTSADERTTGGLTGVVKEHGCKVVAPTAGVAEVRKRCPLGAEVLTSDEWEKQGGLDGRVIPLAGRGKAPIAYQFRWADKTVLVSGRMPIKLTEKSIEELMAEVTGLGGSVAEFVKSLERLQAVHPNLWLPAVPIQGQNANLYDQEWAKVLAQNNRLVSR